MRWMVCAISFDGMRRKDERREKRKRKEKKRRGGDMEALFGWVFLRRERGLILLGCGLAGLLEFGPFLLDFIFEFVDIDEK